MYYPTTVNDVTYPSIAACARAHGISPACLTQRLASGIPIEEAVNPKPRRGNPGKPTYANGVQYESVAALAAAHGQSRSMIKQRIKRGMTAEEAITTPPLHEKHWPRTINGVEYESAADCSARTGIPIDTIVSRIRQGVPDELILSKQRLGRTRARHVVDSVTYTTVKSLVDAYGIDKGSFRKELQNGLSAEEAVHKIVARLKPHAKKVETETTTYASVTEFANNTGTPDYIIRRRMNRGIPPEIAAKNGPIRKLRRQDGTDVFVPFRRKPKFAFTDDDGTHQYYAMCPTCKTPLLLTEDELSTFEHATDSCLARRLPPETNVTDKTVLQWPNVHDIIQNAPGRRPERTSVTYDGVTYSTLDALAEAHDTNKKALEYRLNKGQPLSEALTSNGQDDDPSGPVTAFGITYPNRETFIKTLGLTKGTANYKLRKGVNPELVALNITTRPMWAKNGRRIQVPFSRIPRFAFTNAAGEQYYYAQCQTCRRLLILRESDLTTFRHDDATCSENELPPTAEITDQTVRNWLKPRK